MAPPARLIVEADGAARGNPGPASYGAVVRDAVSGAVLAEASAAIGIATNNVAEYRGLIAGLHEARKINPDASIEARLDSRLVVEQMSGNWKIKHPSMRPLALEASRVFPTGQVTYRWLPREHNAHADRLANEALDAANSGDPWRLGGENHASTAKDHASRGVVGWGADLGVPTTLMLLRHGETALSVEKRFAGVRQDVPLSPAGESQAAAAARHLRSAGGIDVIVSSPLLRARATADAVSAELGLPVDIDDDLRECDFGDWDGLTYAEVQAKWPAELAAWLGSPSAAPPSGESFDAVGRRVRRARDRLLRAHPGETALVVTHVSPIKELVRLALGAPASALFRMELATASRSIVQWYADGNAVLRLFNENAHVRRSTTD